jgi:hypothetical protein
MNSLIGLTLPAPPDSTDDHLSVERTMKRWLRFLLASGLVWAAISENASAQGWQIGGYNQPNVRSRPTYSPYLNLGQGTGGASAYYGIVRPQFDINRNTIQLGQLQQFVNQPPGAVGPGMGDQPQLTLDTGHHATFFSTSHYFGTGAPRGGGGTGGATGGVPGFGTNANNANNPNNVFLRR